MANQTDIHRSIAMKSPEIIKDFKFLYGIILGLLIVGSYYIFSENSLADFFRFSLGPWLGRIAILLLGIVILPGILGRFRIEIPLTRIITLFRRQLGITVFLIALTHYEFVRGVDVLSGKIPVLPVAIFEFFAIFALTILFFMFLTSNNASVKKMGKWWKRLHRLVYITVWLLAFHTGLQRISIWSVYIGVFALLEVSSLLYNKFSAKQSQ